MCNSDEQTGHGHGERGKHSHGCRNDAPTNGHNILVVDPVSGAAGDMWLGALVDLGVPWEELTEALRGLGVDGYELRRESVISKGIRATKVNVLLDDRPQPHRHLHHVAQIIESSAMASPVKEMAIRVFTRLAESEAKVHGCSVEKVHFHEVGAVDAIVDIVGTCWALEYLKVEEILVLPLPLGSGTVRCAHGVMPVPAPATADLVRDFPVYLGGGEGELVTPTGAALCTTLGRPHDSHSQGMPLRIERIGHGAGSRPAKDRPNVLRLLLGRREEAGKSWLVCSGGMTHAHGHHHGHGHKHASGHGHGNGHGIKQENEHRHEHGHENGHEQRDDHGHDHGHGQKGDCLGELQRGGSEHGAGGVPALLWEDVQVIETTVDDMNPQWLSPLTARLFDAGALDVQAVSVMMKKGRLGCHLTVLCPPERGTVVLEQLFAESTTLGVRSRLERRACLERDWVTVTTEGGPVRLKRGILAGRVVNIHPEFDDCQAAARRGNLPIKEIHRQALAAYEEIRPEKAE
ncbi:nickel pincer cofactor biosynthesis protein LarC [Heliobacterium undosum]|uniref:Pyridinium-3,5-bisthiocarboxylic acid mononucleotide nickel insertion protein n=1 Tax=Heliomicrobium undosum TaxID=121734 RepID=A0A845L9L6_9FIRM|nr:nickel pincer cofactor biosynthesis protein LarC [Heliomicrobium undosum]MZP30398.1 nickel pincer cofactor biosynthesis protein LarC [Heliomicrobium undosum]